MSSGEWRAWLQATSSAWDEGGGEKSASCICNSASDCRWQRKNERHLMLPYRKAPCYGLCPQYDDFSVVQCKQCKRWVKPIGFNAHHERRHRVMRGKRATKPMEIPNNDDGLLAIDSERSQSPLELVMSSELNDDFDNILLSPTLSFDGSVQESFTPSTVPKKSLSAVQLPIRQNKQSSNKVQRPQKNSKTQGSNYRLNEHPSANTIQQNHSTESYYLQSADGLRLKIAKNIAKKETDKTLPKVESTKSLRKETQRKDERKRKSDKFVKTEEESVERPKNSDLPDDTFVVHEVDEKILHTPTPSTSAFLKVNDRRQDSSKAPTLTSQLSPRKNEPELLTMLNQPADGTFIPLGARQPQTRLSEIRQKADLLKKMSQETSQAKVETQRERSLAAKAPPRLLSPVASARTASEGQDAKLERSLSETPPPPLLTQEAPMEDDRHSPEMAVPSTSISVEPFEAPVVPALRLFDATMHAHLPPRPQALTSSTDRLIVYSDVRDGAENQRRLLDRRRTALRYLIKKGLIESDDSESDDDEGSASAEGTRYRPTTTDAEVEELASKLDQAIRFTANRYAQLIVERKYDRYITAVAGLVDQDTLRMAASDANTSRLAAIEERQKQTAAVQATKSRASARPPMGLGLSRLTVPRSRSTSRRNAQPAATPPPSVVVSHLPPTQLQRNPSPNSSALSTASTTTSAAPQLRALLSSSAQNAPPPPIVTSARCTSTPSRQQQRRSEAPPGTRVLPVNMQQRQPRKQQVAPVIVPTVSASTTITIPTSPSHNPNNSNGSSRASTPAALASMQHNRYQQQQQRSVTVNENMQHPSQTPTPPMITSPVNVPASPQQQQYWQQQQPRTMSSRPQMRLPQSTQLSTSRPIISTQYDQSPSVQIDYEPQRGPQRKRPRTIGQQQGAVTAPVLPITSTQFVVTGSGQIMAQATTANSSTFIQSNEHAMSIGDESSLQQHVSLMQRQQTQQPKRGGLLGNEPMQSQRHQSMPNGQAPQINTVGSQLLSRESSAFSIQSPMRPNAVRPITVAQPIRVAMPNQFNQQPLIHVVQQQQLFTSPNQQYAPQQPQHIQIVYKGMQGATVPSIARMPQPQQQAHRY